MHGTSDTKSMKTKIKAFKFIYNINSIEVYKSPFFRGKEPLILGFNRKKPDSEPLFYSFYFFIFFYCDVHWIKEWARKDIRRQEHSSKMNLCPAPQTMRPLLSLSHTHSSILTLSRSLSLSLKHAGGGGL